MYDFVRRAFDALSKVVGDQRKYLSYAGLFFGDYMLLVKDKKRGEIGALLLS